MSENDFFYLDQLEEIEPGIFKIFCMIPSGVVLVMYNKPIRFFKANTFLPNALLNTNQIELKKDLIEELEKYKYTSGNMF